MLVYPDKSVNPPVKQNQNTGNGTDSVKHSTGDLQEHILNAPSVHDECYNLTMHVFGSDLTD